MCGHECEWCLCGWHHVCSANVIPVHLLGRDWWWYAVAACLDAFQAVSFVCRQRGCSQSAVYTKTTLTGPRSLSGSKRRLTVTLRLHASVHVCCSMVVYSDYWHLCCFCSCNYIRCSIVVADAVVDAEADNAAVASVADAATAAVADAATASVADAAASSVDATAAASGEAATTAGPYKATQMGPVLLAPLQQQQHLRAPVYSRVNACFLVSLIAFAGLGAAGWEDCLVGSGGHDTVSSTFVPPFLRSVPATGGIAGPCKSCAPSRLHSHGDPSESNHLRLRLLLCTTSARQLWCCTLTLSADASRLSKACLHAGTIRLKVLVLSSSNCFLSFRVWPYSPLALAVLWMGVARYYGPGSFGAVWL